MKATCSITMCWTIFFFLIIQFSGTITDTMGKAGTMRIGISMTEIAMTTGDVVTMATGMMSMTTDMVMTTGQPEVFWEVKVTTEEGTGIIDNLVYIYM